MDVGDEIEKAVAGRWIAGATIKDALDVARKLNGHGVGAQINYLGELFTKAKDVADAISTYEKLIQTISKNKIKADVSVKPSQLGMLMGDGLLKENFARIAEAAEHHGVFVWIDMEEDTYTDKEIWLHGTQMGKGNVGICIQSYMRRSLGDVRMLVRKGAAIRLVKGAYYTPRNRNYLDRPKATTNFLKIMGYLFEHSKRFMLATHDVGIIEKARVLNKMYKRDVEFAMLNGINNKYIADLARAGERASIYVPFGSRWLDYSYRRLKERSNLKLIMESILEG